MLGGPWAGFGAGAGATGLEQACPCAGVLQAARRQLRKRQAAAGTVWAARAGAWQEPVCEQMTSGLLQIKSQPKPPLPEASSSLHPGLYGLPTLPLAYQAVLGQCRGHSAHSSPSSARLIRDSADLCQQQWQHAELVSWLLPAALLPAWAQRSPHPGVSRTACSCLGMLARAWLDLAKLPWPLERENLVCEGLGKG